MSSSIAIQLLFWLLVVAVVQPFRLRLALVAFLVLAHVDLSAPGTTSTHAVGLGNALKAVVLPAWLALEGWMVLRRRSPHGLSPSRLFSELAGRPVALLWVLFVGYAAAAVIWSPYPLSAVEFVGALTGYTLAFAAFLMFWLSGTLNHRVVLWSLSAIVGLGVLQTYLLGGAYSSRGNWAWERFTTFSSPQSFAEGTVILFCILLWHPRWGAGRKSVVAGALLLITFASGSRIGLLGAVGAILVWLVRKLDVRRVALLAIGLLGVSTLLLLPPVRAKIASSRVGQLQLFRGGVGAATRQIQTVNWRLNLYDCLLRHYQQGTPSRLLLGSGTAGTGQAALECHPGYDPRTFSPTRVAHSEPIRFLYEWGLVGASVMLLFVLSLTWAGVRAFLLAGAPDSDVSDFFGPFASALPLLALTIGLENLLQAAGAPNGMALALVLAQLGAGFLLRRHQHAEAEAVTPTILPAPSSS